MARTPLAAFFNSQFNILAEIWPNPHTAKTSSTKSLYFS